MKYTIDIRVHICKNRSNPILQEINNDQYSICKLNRHYNPGATSTGVFAWLFLYCAKIESLFFQKNSRIGTGEINKQ